MFDITSSKLLLLAIVALLVIGPKDFPMLLRAIGKYVGIIRGHAKEFRAQFDEAMRETELSELKKDVEGIARETEASLSATKDSVDQTFDEAREGVEASPAPPPAAGPPGHDADDAAGAAPRPAPAEVAAGVTPEATPAAPEAPSAGETPAPAAERTGA